MVIYQEFHFYKEIIFILKILVIFYKEIISL